jgi:hypothetical protein
VRTIVSAESSYTTAYPALGYSTLAMLGGPNNGCVPSSLTACIIDDVLTNGTKSGYVFAAAGLLPVNGANTEYLITSDPQNVDVTGVKGFCAAEDNVIRFVSPDAGPATHASCLSSYSPIGQ